MDQHGLLDSPLKPGVRIFLGVLNQSLQHGQLGLQATRLSGASGLSMAEVIFKLHEALKGFKGLVPLLNEMPVEAACHLLEIEAFALGEVSEGGRERVKGAEFGVELREFYLVGDPGDISGRTLNRRNVGVLHVVNHLLQEVEPRFEAVIEGARAGLIVEEASVKAEKFPEGSCPFGAVVNGLVEEPRG